MWSELKAFLMRGNLLSLAVAVIIGTAFGKSWTRWWPMSSRPFWA